jgi:GAF domain-containing protein
VGFAVRTGTVVNISDPSNDNRFDISYDKRNNFKTDSILCAPIQHEGKVAGVIELLNSKNPDGFTQDEANILSYIGGAAGEYLENSMPIHENFLQQRKSAGNLPLKN